MTATNRVQIALVREATIGTTPNSPRMRKARFTSGSPQRRPEYVDPDEIRSDRMNDDPIPTVTTNNANLNGEFSYPVDETFFSELLRNVFWSPWVNTPQFDNDGTADSVITGVTDSSDTFAVSAGGAAVKAGHLVRTTGFTNAANNGIFRAASSTGTTVVMGGTPTLADEATPPGTARMKVVGFQGASGDITAAAGGLASTALDFTTLGLVPGQWLKIGGTATGDKFATAANNDSVRISGTITATSIPLDNLPVGWGVDSGTGKTIKVWFGDQIKNGVTEYGHTIEFGYMGQAVPTYIVGRGQHVNTMQFSAQNRQKITWQAAFMGMGGGSGTVALDASPDEAPTNLVMGANASVGRLAEAGARLTSPNWARSLTWTINNNLRSIEALDEPEPVAVREGECTVTGTIETFFGSTALLAKFYAGTPTNLNSRFQKNAQMVIWQIPRATYRGGGDPNVTGKNADVMLSLEFTASRDTLTNAHVICDRLEYYE